MSMHLVIETIKNIAINGASLIKKSSYTANGTARSLFFTVPEDVKLQQDLIVAAPQLNKNNAELPDEQKDVNLVF